MATGRLVRRAMASERHRICKRLVGCGENLIGRREWLRLLNRRLRISEVASALPTVSILLVETHAIAGYQMPPACHSSSMDSHRPLLRRINRQSAIDVTLRSRCQVLHGRIVVRIT